MESNTDKKMKMLKINIQCCAFLLLLVMQLPLFFANATEWHVTPAGAGKHTGKNLADAWDLTTAFDPALQLQGGKVQPGDVIWVHAGRYNGEKTSLPKDKNATYQSAYRVKIAGTSLAPIIVRNYPGENPVLDGANMFSLLREKRVVSRSNGVLNITAACSNVWFWGLEITNSNTYRFAPHQDKRKTNSLGTLDIGCGIVVYGTDIRLVDLVIHDMIDCGITAFHNAVGIHIEGCLIYFNGYNGGPGEEDDDSKERSHGHGIYTNGDSSDAKRVIKGNIVFSNSQFGIKVYTQGGGIIRNYDVDNNFSFNNGTIFLTYTKGDNWKWVANTNIFVGGHQPANNVSIQGNHAVYSHFSEYTGLNKAISNEIKYGKNMEIGFGMGYPNKDFVIQQNYIIGGDKGVIILNPLDIVFSNNTVLNYDKGLQVVDYLSNRTVASSKSVFPFVNVKSWDNNTYYFPSNVKTPMILNYPDNTAPFPYKDKNVSGHMIVRKFDFKLWKAEFPVIDKNSKVIEGMPTGTEVIKNQNELEPGRYHVMAYNWDKKSSVDLDMTGIIPNGRVYRLRNAADPLAKPLYENASFSGKISLPMAALSIAVPNGVDIPDNKMVRPRATGPDFGAFIVDFFPYDVTISRTANGAEAKFTNPKDGKPINDQVWQKQLVYEWKKVADNTWNPGSSSSVTLIGHGKVELIVTDANGMKYTATAYSY